MKIFFKMVIILAALIGAWHGYAYMSNPFDKSGDENASKTPQFFEVVSGELLSRVACTGKINSNLDVEIKGKASGEVVAVHVDISDKVSKGDLLVEIDPVEEERNLRQARIALEASTARLEKAKAVQIREEASIALERVKAERSLSEKKVLLEDAVRRAERNSALFAKKLVSEETRDSAVLALQRARIAYGEAETGVDQVGVAEKGIVTLKQDVILAEAQKENDEIAVDKAARRLDETRVYAPMDGVISARQVQKGLIVSSPTSNVGGGTTMMVISDLTRLFACATVDECDIGVVAVGQTAEVTADAFPGKIFEGVVSRVAAKGAETSSVVTFEVLVEIRGEALSKVKPGMTANITISARTAGRVLLVPSKAIVKRGGETFLAVLPGNGGDRRGEGRRKEGLGSHGATGEVSALRGGPEGRPGRGGNRRGRGEFAAKDGAGDSLADGPERSGLTGETGASRGKRRGGAAAGGPDSLRLVKITTGREADGMTEVVSGARPGMKAVIPTAAAESKWNRAGGSGRARGEREPGDPGSGSRSQRGGSGPGIMGMMRRMR